MTAPTVYFLQAGPAGPIKIGATKYTERRLLALAHNLPQAARCLGVIPDAAKLEAKLHRQFKGCQIKGEWFAPTDDLLSFIEAQAQPFDIDLTPRPKGGGRRKGAGRPREDENRMPKAEAAPIWHDVRIKTNDEALEQMWGWSPSAAHRYLGPSGRPKAGRPKKPPQKPKSKRR